jgi:hypothetical protein
MFVRSAFAFVCSLFGAGVILEFQFGTWDYFDPSRKHPVIVEGVAFVCLLFGAAVILEVHFGSGTLSYINT